MSQDATKQLSFKTLPTTLAIQLKVCRCACLRDACLTISSLHQRFEHNNNNSVKVDTSINFPTDLDMRPYMTDSLQG